MNFDLKTRAVTARLAVGLLLQLGAAWAQAPQVGTSVNMVIGMRFPEGAPFLTKQNEPSIAVSYRGIVGQEPRLKA
jgi:hypothetical protein